MKRTKSLGFASLIAASALAVVSPVQAAESSAESANSEDAAEGEEDSEAEVAPDAKAEEVTPPPATETSSVSEEKDKTYYFVGARYRMVTIPKFVLNLFADGGDTAIAHHAGLEFGIRENGFEYSIFGMLGMYGLTNTPFKGKTDPPLAWEIVNPDFKILYLGSDFMWSTKEVLPGLSFHYGAGIGIGIVFGQLGRQQAFPLNGKANDPTAYRACSSAGDVRGATVVNGVPANFCGGDTNHYGTYSESSPSPVYPWIAGQIGVRYKVHKHFVARLDAGIMVPGAFIGIGADYGL